MRLWSIHPKYLDAKGLVALWREALLAKKVLEGKTKGYKHHPQLQRFKETENPVNSINRYLSEVYYDAAKRNYNFDRRKINWNFSKKSLKVTDGQLEYEVKHLLIKLKKRDMRKFKELRNIIKFSPHPMFRVTKGDIEGWEII
jgi:hypothetical protein